MIDMGDDGKIADMGLFIGWIGHGQPLAGAQALVSRKRPPRALQFWPRFHPAPTTEVYKLYTVMNLKSSGVFAADFRSLSGPQKPLVQFGAARLNRRKERTHSSRRSASAFAERVEGDRIFKEPFGDMT